MGFRTYLDFALPAYGFCNVVSVADASSARCLFLVWRAAWLECALVLSVLPNASSFPSVSDYWFSMVGDCHGHDRVLEILPYRNFVANSIYDLGDICYRFESQHINNAIFFKGRESILG